MRTTYAYFLKPGHVTKPHNTRLTNSYGSEFLTFALARALQRFGFFRAATPFLRGRAAAAAASTTRTDDVLAYCIKTKKLVLDNIYMLVKSRVRTSRRQTAPEV